MKRRKNSTDIFSGRVTRLPFFSFASFVVVTRPYPSLPSVLRPLLSPSSRWQALLPEQESPPPTSAPPAAVTTRSPTPSRCVQASFGGRKLPYVLPSFVIVGLTVVIVSGDWVISGGVGFMVGGPLAG